MIEKEMYNKEKKTASPRVEPKLSVLSPNSQALRHAACLPITSEKKLLYLKHFSVQLCR